VKDLKFLKICQNRRTNGFCSRVFSTLDRVPLLARPAVFGRAESAGEKSLRDPFRVPTMAAMQPPPGHRKLVKHYDDLRHARELTFSCFQRWPLLTSDTWREMLSRAIDSAGERHHWRLTAFVYMPEHVHLLWFPLPTASKIEHLLKAIKRPYSFRSRGRKVRGRKVSGTNGT